MGKIKNGILGGFSGTVGTVVGAKWKSIDTMRARPKRRKTPPTPAEEAQQAKFSLVSTFMTPMREMFETGFKAYIEKQTGLNAAMGYALKNAVMGAAPDFYILCEYVQVCRGELPNVTEAIAGTEKADQVTFKWTNNAGRGKANDKDKAILIVLCHACSSCVFTFTGAPRSAGTDTLHVHGFSGHEVQTWLSFMSKDKEDIAPSIFTGQFIVA
jgi:hypothetical protein